jgi:hypothetical protein
LDRGTTASGSLTRIVDEQTISAKGAFPQKFADESPNMTSNLYRDLKKKLALDSNSHTFTKQKTSSQNKALIRPNSAVSQSH